ncbi:unnamed protein product, partial [Allacma fusca]
VFCIFIVVVLAANINGRAIDEIQPKSSAHEKPVPTGQDASQSNKNMVQGLADIK